MKTLFVILSSLLLVFIVGCQESSITDPVADNTAQVHSSFMENSLNKDITYPNVIKLDGSLSDPSHFFNSYAEIGGVLQYRIDKVQFDRRPPYTGIKVSLKVNAELKTDCPHATRSWLVNGRTNTILNTSPAVQITNSFEKSFKVNYTCCGKLNLVMKFSLSGKYLTLESMKLVKVNSMSVPVGDPISE